MVVKPLFPSRSLNRIDLKPDTLYRVRTSYPQLIERQIIDRVTALSVRKWTKYIDGDGGEHYIWIDYITIDTTFNICDIYFYVDGSVAIVIIVGVLVVAGLLALALVVKQVAVVVRGYPHAPASRMEFPLIIVGGLVVLAAVLYYGGKSGTLSRLAAKVK